MASYHGNTHSETAKMEQIITEFFAKSLHIILESRCPYVSSHNYSGEHILSSPSSSTSSSSSVRPRDKWFNLALRDCPAALENIDFWRQSNYEPMVVDVILVQRPSDLDSVNCSPRRGLVRNLSSKEQIPSYWNTENDEFGWEAKSEKIIERWVVQYESRKSGNGGSGNKRSICTSSHTLYKKSILLMRSLYMTVRLLPAYNLFREINSSGQIRMYSLAHRVSTSVEPFTRPEEAKMQRFVFSPVDTSYGRLCLSVLYRSSPSDVTSEPSTPISPQVITDYVGSPMADPLKRFPSIPSKSPSCSPFERRHSWSSELYRTSPPSALPSPSPTYSESRASISKLSSHRFPPPGITYHQPETSQAHVKNTSFDEYWPSPSFSSSPSPSPPTYIPGSHKSKALLRSESAPVNIPASKFSHVSHLANKQGLPPSPPLKKTTGPGVSKMDRTSGLVQTRSTVEKFTFGKDEIGKLSGMKISSNSFPRKSFSRSSSRLSFQDDFDDSEFFVPFVVDDDDLADHSSRLGSFDQTGHPCERQDPQGFFPVRSQDAAVGALVHTLKKAPPLRQDASDSLNLLPGSKPEILSNLLQHQAASFNVSSSGVFASKTTADALDELRRYREMKDQLLEKAGNET